MSDERLRSCLKCGSPLSGDSLVCSFCGVAVRSESDGIDSFETIATEIEQTLADLKSSLRRGVFAAVKARAWWILTLLMLLVLAVALSPSASDQYTVHILAFGLFPLLPPLILLIYIRIKFRNRYGADYRSLQKRLADKMDTAARHYGDDAEVRSLLAQYRADLTYIHRGRQQDHINGGIGFALILFLFIFVLWLVPPYRPSLFENITEDLTELPMHARPLRKEINGPLAPFLQTTETAVEIRHVIYRGAGRVDIEARPEMKVVHKRGDKGTPALNSFEFTLNMYILDSRGMPLHLRPLTDTPMEGYGTNPLYNDYNEYHPFFQVSLNESDYSPGEWLSVVQALKNAAAGTPRYIITSSLVPAVTKDTQ